MTNHQNDFDIRLAHPDIGPEELEAVGQVLASGVLTNGPRTSRFEEAFALRHDVPFAIAFANGTVALSAMYLALGIGPGDEVVVPSMTFVSSATSVLHVGANPVFADIDSETFNLDSRDVARRITKRTKAILAVHYGGQSADMSSLQELADRAQVFLLEDAAEAHGAAFRDRPVGGLGKAAMFSFTPTKNITMGEGGIVTTRDELLAARLRLLRNHGQTGAYQHAIVGYNWRLTEMQAAIGEIQLHKLDGILQRKRANAERMALLLEGASGVQIPRVKPDRIHTYMLYTLLVPDRDQMMTDLHEAGIEGRVYFPPVHRQPIFSEKPVALPVTEAVSPRMLSLPFHSLITDAELKRMASVVRASVAKSTRSRAKSIEMNSDSQPTT